MEQTQRKQDILVAALEAGRILLENGAEISRVRDTVQRICHHFGMESVHLYMLSNGIFLTAGNKKDPEFAHVEEIPVNRTNLSRITEINQLSRQISRGTYTVPEVRQELKRIQALPSIPRYLQILAAGIGGACFSYMCGGDGNDAVCALGIGALLYLFLLNIGSPLFSRLVCHILCGGWITFLSLLCYYLGLGHHLDALLISGIILMVPGVAFTNGIRDMASGDYLSGCVRLLDALLVFFGLAIGVGAVMTLYRHLTGGGPFL